MSNAIIVNGKCYPVNVPVKLWDETGLEVVPWRGARKRRRSITVGVWHWTGGEGGAAGLFRVLRNKGYGVEFYIDQAGTIWQFCDPALVDTFDAGWMNSRSFGVEIANYGFRRRGVLPPKRGRGRPTYLCKLNGRRREFAHFWPAQFAAAMALADAMSNACPVPRSVPTIGGQVVNPNTLEPEEAQHFAGHLGHFHITKRKSDPGLDLLSMFAAQFAQTIRS